VLHYAAFDRSPTLSHSSRSVILMEWWQWILILVLIGLIAVFFIMRKKNQG
jgi:hypothetical protein